MSGPAGASETSATLLARELVTWLLEHGVTEAVLCPGSRNAPLGFALHAAHAQRLLRLHVRIDERAAGFLGLGLAAGSHTPVPVVCTSGTAVANLHPAMLEAAYSGIALLAVTADRPAGLRGTGANQTIDQRGLFAPAVSLVQLTATGQLAERAEQLRGLLRAGPAHLNVELDQPLTPRRPWRPAVDQPAADQPAADRPAVDQHRWRPDAGSAPPVAAQHRGRRIGPRTLVIAGHGGAAAAELGRRYGWPVIAEPASGSWGATTDIPAGAALLGALLRSREHAGAGGDADGGADGGAAELWPQRVIVCGRPTVHRAVASLIADAEVELLHVPAAAGQRWVDPGGRAVPLRAGFAAGSDPEWLRGWQQAGERVRSAIAAALGTTAPSGPRVAAEVVAAVAEGDGLVLGSSAGVRDVALAARARADVAVHANRGVAGIDGTVSTAAGLALAGWRHTVVYLGDLSFLHDLNGLLLGPAEPRPDLTVVVHNDDGGGIFHTLEQGQPEYAADFERIFGTPHGADLASLCAGYGAVHRRVSVGELAAALPALREHRQGRIHVLEVGTERGQRRDTQMAMHDAACAGLAGSGWADRA